MAKVSVTWAGGRTWRRHQAVGSDGRVSHQKLIRKTGYGANVIVHRIGKMFIKECLGGPLDEPGIGEEKFVDWLGKTTRHGVFGEPAPV